MIVRNWGAPALAFDRAMDVLAFDRASVRRKDEDGRLHVAVSNISKATVNPYRGAEIPRWRDLGLVPDRVYRLFRDPDELAKGAATFNNIPILSEHVPISADKPRPELVVGSTGTDAAFTAPYLTNSLVVWDADAIEGIEGEDARELSSCYRYDADMTPGSFEGEAYDGVMRNLRGNHVALVEAGRAGSDVMVGDSRPEGIGDNMKVPLSRKALLVSGAIRAYLGPKMAADSKIDISPILNGVTSKNFPARISGIVTKLKKACDGHLAADADLDDFVEMLDALKDEDVGEDEPAPARAGGSEVDQAQPRQPGMDDAGGLGKIKEFLKANGVSDEVLAKLDAVVGAPEAEDEEDEDAKKKREAAEMAAKDKAARDAEPPAPKDKEPKDMVSKGAMDAALKTHGADVERRTIARLRSIATAEALVKPHVGEIKVAMDSASDVLRFALETKGVDVPDDASEAALSAMVAMLPAPGDARRSSRPLMAADSKATESFTKRFPTAVRPRNLGA